MVKRFFIQNFGCRATQADGAALEGLLEREGMCASGEAASADLVILNTCTVTAAADEDVRKSIRRVHRENPAARILVTGCYAQRAPAEIARIPGVAWVVGNTHKAAIPDLVAGPAAPADDHGQIVVGGIGAQTAFLSAPVEDSFGGRTRPNLKIQDGCNNPCTFCIIPSVRGRSRSMEPGAVLEQVRQLAARYAEVVLTGINLGRWGREPGFPAAPMRLKELLARILAETPVRRVRLSSIEPMDLTGDLLRLIAGEPRIARHIHTPLQSASDAVLKSMKRRYRVRHYEDRLLEAHSLLPEAAFGADVMTGFPGETEADFEETRRFIERMPFTYLHVFTYSERPGTPAARMPGQVPHTVRKERTRTLRELGARKNLEFRRRMVGRTLEAVTLESGQALTTNYLAVEMAAERPANQIVMLRIGGVTTAGLGEAGRLRVIG